MDNGRRNLLKSVPFLPSAIAGVAASLASSSCSRTLGPLELIVNERRVQVEHEDNSGWGEPFFNQDTLKIYSGKDLNSGLEEEVTFKQVGGTKEYFVTLHHGDKKEVVYAKYRQGIGNPRVLEYTNSEGRKFTLNDRNREGKGEQILAAQNTLVQSVMRYGDFMKIVIQSKEYQQMVLPKSYSGRP